MQIDGSLAKMYYLNLNQNEWIYRGSSRLKPLLKEFQAAKYRMQTGHRGRIVTESLSVRIIKMDSEIFMQALVY